MYAEERQRLILDRAREAGRVDNNDLAALLDVTAETIRRDLKHLERLGHVKRVHGGAIPVERLVGEQTVAARRETRAAEKDAIAKRAVELVPEGGAILIDAGTTTARFAQVLPDDRDLTVVTHAIDIAASLADRPRITPIVLGGRIRQRTLAAVGSWTERMLGELHVDVAFMATNGVSVERGMSTPDVDEASVKRAAIAAAKRTVLLADHTKVGVDHLVQFGAVETIDTLVTDAGLAPALRDEFDAAGVEVVTA